MNTIEVENLIIGHRYMIDFCKNSNNLVAIQDLEKGLSELLEQLEQLEDLEEDCS